MPRQPRLSSTLLAIGLVLAFPLVAASCSSAPREGGFHLLTARGDINPVMANYIARGIAQANRQHAQAVIIKLDTPGGLDSAMRDIVQAIDNSQAPIIVFVAPSGARAASAGTFITMAGHVAAMAPNTAIGAAHPVGLGGQNIGSTLDKKIENDAVAYIRGLAELRGRNAEWAEQAVRQSASISDAEAAQLHVVDAVAPSVEVLLHDLDGRAIRLNDGQEVKLTTAGAAIHDNPMGTFERFLLIISDPDIAFLLLIVGSLALMTELSHGTIVLGVVGAVSFIVGLLSLGTLPISWAGVALMGLAVVLLAAELFVGGYGLLGLAGLLALGLGGLLLTGTSNPDFQVSRWLTVAVPVTAGAALGGMTLFAFSTQRRTVMVGAERLIGAEGIARSPLDLEGFIFVQGERWQASASRAIPEGERVIVTGRTGLHLAVEATREHEDVNPGAESGDPK